MSDGAKPEDRANRLLEDLSDWLWSLVAAPLVSVIGIALYAGSIHSVGVAGAALVVAAAAWITGGFLGFLFAIPRASALAAPGRDESGSRRYLPNSNLVEISDWLTKILVGLGLVELGRLTVETHKLVDFLAPELGGKPRGPAFALAILIVFSVSGFLSLYLVTRLYVLAMFARTDESLREEVERLVIEAQQEAQAEPEQADDEGERKQTD